MQRKIRVLVGKPGLDGHDRGAKVVAAALRDAGMEVIYTGLHQSPEQIVEAAIQEDVDVVALSILSGAHMTLFPEVHHLMTERGIGDKLLTGGGIIPSEDMETLAKQGVGQLFGPGASTQDIAVYIRGWFGQVHPDSAAVPSAARARSGGKPTSPSRATSTSRPKAKRAGQKPAKRRTGSGKKRVAAGRRSRPKSSTKSKRPKARRSTRRSAGKRR